MAAPSFRPVTGASGSEDLRGIFFLCAGIFIFAFQDIIVKLLSSTYPVSEIVFLRALIALPMLFVVVHFDAGLGKLGTKRPFMHALRSVIMFGAFIFYYLALPALPLTTVVALWFTSPLFITALAIPVLGERVGWRRWSGILAGFAGVLIIVRPGLDTFQPTALLAVLAAICYATSQVIGRKIGITESASVMAFYTMLTFLYLGGAIGVVTANLELGPEGNATLQFLIRPWSMPKGLDLALLMMIGVISAFGFVLLSIAYRISVSSVVAPFEYTAMLWASILSFLMWGDVPGPYTVAGTCLIIAGGVYVMKRETAVVATPLASRGPWRARS